MFNPNPPPTPRSMLLPTSFQVWSRRRYGNPRCVTRARNQVETSPEKLGKDTLRAKGESSEQKLFFTQKRAFEEQPTREQEAMDTRTRDAATLSNKRSFSVALLLVLNTYLRKQPSCNLLSARQLVVYRFSKCFSV